LAEKTSNGILYHPEPQEEFGTSVKSFKLHLKRIVDTSTLTIEEMQTLTIQIESILNSRPFTSLLNNPNDLFFFPPGHFLIGDTLTAIHESLLLIEKESRLSRWQRIE